MICPQCKKEIPDDKLFCPYCAAEIRFVPDYNVFEEDYLSSMISEETKENREQKKEDKSNNRKKALRIILPIVLVLIAIVSGILMYLNSYSYYYSRANSSLQMRDYYDSINYSKYALSKDKTTDAYLVLSKAYIGNGNQKDAIKTLKKALKLSPSNEDAYKLLIDIYYKTEDYTSLTNLKATAKTKTLLKLFDNIVIGNVKFSVKAGEYSDFKILKLTTDSDYDIYYTVDGTTPDKYVGIKYEEDKPIELEKGKTTVKACCINDNGVCGKIYTKKYEINFEKPTDPTVNPESGRFVVPTQITISADADCRIYYTWDSTDPTIDSPEYTGPINVIEGNNVLSVIAVDSHGMTSNVIRQNYIFEP
ncbi:MAG: chitobiase/beta-hexosaminidase C-terminal domain-containing protein [Lachnospiraceae bacterium]|nr:chitobiase/beta-hexosaminidase C-terminal domain-containing protein [Lachnospiraceae bacterium]